MESLYIIDGSNLLFRAYHALPFMKTTNGVPSGAVFGFLHMLLRLEEQNPSHWAVVFDAGGKSVRTELYEHYKAHRPSCPEDLVPQFDMASRLASMMGMKVLYGIEGEADDVIATLSKQAQKEGMRVVIVSSDKDLMQLCSEKIVLLDTMKNEGQGIFYGPKEVEEKFGVPPEQLGDVLALMGDASDNIPGVPGIGQKTATQLIQTFGSIDVLLERLDEIQVRGAEKVKHALREHRSQLSLSQQLVKLQDELTLDIRMSDLIRHEGKKEELKKFLSELEFKRVLLRLFPKEGEIKEEANQKNETIHADSSSLQKSHLKTEDTPTLLIEEVQVLTSKEQVAAWINELGAWSEILLGISVQASGFQQESFSRSSKPCGMALYAKHPSRKIAPIYLPLGHLYLGAPLSFTNEDLIPLLQPILADARCQKFVQGVKETHLFLATLGMSIAGVCSDPSLCSYLHDAGQKHDLFSLVSRYLRIEGEIPKTKEEWCKSQKRPVPLESVDVLQVAQTAGFEAQVTLCLGMLLKERLPKDSQDLLEKMEIPLGHLLAKMEQHGILLDTKVLERLSIEVGAQLRTIESDVAKEVGYDVNLNSPKQLQELLFEKLQLQGFKKTKTGLSTDAEALEMLAEQHPIAKKILTHRTLAKLKNTYLDLFPKWVDPKTSRLHTSYHQVVAATGRLSSTEPNLQNIPIRTSLGMQIRRAFVAAPSMALISADYSQIELRVLAHLSQDPLLLSSFLNNEDIHERTAIEMFGPIEGAKSDMRRVAKMINYGIVYGLTDFGLGARLSIPRNVAKEYIKEYFSRYQGVATFMTTLVEKAKKEGGARTILGRFRPIAELSSGNYQVRAYGERVAKNTPIQGTAADILKLAMIQVQKTLEDHKGLGANMLLTVHDELVLEAPLKHQQEVMDLVKTRMEKACILSVPLSVDIHDGHSWADCKS